MTVTIGMPEMAVNGLSENWLNRFCGNSLWDGICESLGVESSQLTSGTGDRLYPTFIAICGSYGPGVSEVRENAKLDSALSLARFGSSFFHGHVHLKGDGTSVSQELLTAFVERVTPDRNDLRKSSPDSAFSCTAEELAAPPELLMRSRAVRKQTLSEYALEGHAIPIASREPLFETRYEPSPYFDFNGAHLLYFATYPTISDIAERQFMNRDGVADWALRSSTRARHTFYLANLDLGDAVLVQVRHSASCEGGHLLHTTILREKDRVRMAEIFTLKALD